MILKIGSLNVHKLEPFEDRLNDIVALLRKHKINVMCFQEITRSSLKKLSEITNMQSHFWFGSGILTSLNIHDYEQITLPNFRGGLKITLTYENKDDKYEFKFMLTHLCHLFENIRLKQLKVLEPYLTDVDFLIGDMNSLHINDYSKTRYSNINKKRLLAGKEEAKCDLVERIKMNNFHINEFIGQTCPYGTRVDYIFYKTNCMKRYGMMTKTDELIDTVTNNVSDHNMLITKIKK